MSHAPRIPAVRARALPLTHFIGLSLVTPASRPQLQSTLEAFRDAARNDKGLLIPDTVANHAIRPVDTLHLTICTLSLPEKEPERLQQVISRLQELDVKKLWHEAYSSKLEGGNVSPSRHLEDESTRVPVQSSNLITPATDISESQGSIAEKPPALCVTLRGVDTMRNPSKTSVVYAPPDDPAGTLQKFCESIREEFRPYLPSEVPPRDPELETAKEESESASAARPTLESFPHPDSYKSDISIPSTPGPSASSERPVSPPSPLSEEPATADLLSGESHLSKRQQKRLARDHLPHLILHATLLNTIYVRKHNRKDRRSITIDARPLLERFRDTVWMEDVRIEKLCLFRMGAKEVMNENGNGTGVLSYVAEAERDLNLYMGNAFEHVGETEEGCGVIQSCIASLMLVLLERD